MWLRIRGPFGVDELINLEWVKSIQVEIIEKQDGNETKSKYKVSALMCIGDEPIWIPLLIHEDKDFVDRFIEELCCDISDLGGKIVNTQLAEYRVLSHLATRNSKNRGE